MKKSESVTLGFVFYILSVPAAIANPMVGIACFVIGNIFMFWNLGWNFGGNQYHTHYHNYDSDNQKEDVLARLDSIRQQVNRPHNVTQATEHRVENKIGQAISVRKVTKWS